MRAFQPISSLLPALVLALGLPLTAWAQEGVVQGLHARGYAGFTYSRDASGQITGQGFGQEISTDLQGVLFRPDFVSFGTSFSYGHSSASISSGLGTASDSYAGSASFLVLPASAYPLGITYQRTRVGLGGTGLESNTNSDRLGFDWRLDLTHLPKFSVRYGKDSSWSDVPAGFNPARSQGSGWSIAATDSYKGWNWDVSWLRSSSEITQVLLSTPANFEQTYSILSANVLKRYWRGKGTFNYNFSRTGSNTENGFLSSQDGVQMSHLATTSVRFTRKLMAAGAFQYFTYSSEGSVTDPSDPSKLTSLITPPVSGYVGSGSVSYQLHPRISLSDSTSYSAASTLPSPQEQVTGYFTNSPAVAGNYTWRRIRFTTTYGLTYTRSATNFERAYASLSHSGGVTASWSHPWVSLSGGFGIGHGASEVLPGSYADTTNYSFTADSAKLRKLGKLHFRWQRYSRTLLGSVGFIQNNRDTWSLALTRKRWQVEGGANYSSGARQAFGDPTVSFAPLPRLVGVPLLNDNVSSYFVIASAMLRRNLRVHGTYRRDLDEIRREPGGTATYTLFEAYADYRIGRVTIEASYGRYLNASETAASHFGSSSDRFRFRIIRTFDLF